MSYPRILFKFSDGTGFWHHYVRLESIAEIEADILFYLRRDPLVEWDFLT